MTTVTLKTCPFANLLKDNKLISTEDDIVFADYSRTTCPWINKDVHALSVIDPDEKISRDSKPVNSVIDLIGQTPMVRLDRIKKHFGLKCELLAKCEFFNPGGSVKDRIGKSMILSGEDEGILDGVKTLIEPTSGNTGIGLGVVAAVKGYKLIITLPEKMSEEKSNIMKALGCDIIRTPTEVHWNDRRSHMGMAIYVRNNIHGSYILDQYRNPDNPMIHYETTGAEILKQCNNKVDMVVIGSGTGGTISGVGKRMKDYCPSCLVVGVDPKGSVVAVPDSLNDEKRSQSYKVEGIGYDFIPPVLDRSVVDKWVKTDDPESFRMARLIIQLEGLLVGGSSGAALAGALQVCKDLKEGQTCVIIFPDSSRNYINKFISMDWMIDNGFEELPKDDIRFLIYGDETVKSLPLKPSSSIQDSKTIKDAIEIMTSSNIEYMPVINDEKKIIGYISQDDILKKLGKEAADLTDKISFVTITRYKECSMDQPLREVAHMLMMNPFVVVKGPELTFISKANLLQWIATKSL